MSEQEFIDTYIAPAMELLAHDYLCHPERIDADSREVLRILGQSVPPVAEVECDGNCRRFIDSAHGRIE